MEGKNEITYKIDLTEKELNLIVNMLATSVNLKWVDSNPLIMKITQYYQLQKRKLDNELKKDSSDNGDNISDNTEAGN